MFQYRDVALVLSSILTRTLRLTKPCDFTILPGLWQGTRLTKHRVTFCKRKGQIVNAKLVQFCNTTSGHRSGPLKRFWVQP